MFTDESLKQKGDLMYFTPSKQDYSKIALNVTEQAVARFAGQVFVIYK